jgi:hypothetical protein
MSHENEKSLEKAEDVTQDALEGPPIDNDVPAAKCAREREGEALKMRDLRQDAGSKQAMEWMTPENVDFRRDESPDGRGEQPEFGEIIRREVANEQG